MNTKKWLACLAGLGILAYLIYFMAGILVPEAVPDRRVTLSVGVVNDPRFRPIDSDDILKIRSETEKMARSLLGLKLDLKISNDVMTVDEYFERRIGKLKHPDIYDALSLDLRGGNTERIKRAYRSQIKELFPGEDALSDLRQHLEPNPDNASLSADEVVDRLIDQFVERGQQVLMLKNDVGDYIIDPDRPQIHQYFQWSLAALAEDEYDLVFTNELLASAELVDIDLHYLTRGGINGGLTTNSRRPFGGTSYVSAYPFYSTDTFFIERRTVPIPEGRENDAVAAMAVHELGHLVLRWGHPWEQWGCIMRPATGLDFWSWRLSLKPGACRDLKTNNFFGRPQGEELADAVAKLGFEQEAADIRRKAKENAQALVGR